MSETVVKRVVVPAVAQYAIDSAWERVTSAYGIERVRAPWLSVSTTEKEDDAEEELAAMMLWPERADEVLMLLKEARPHEEAEDRRSLSTAARRVAKATGVSEAIGIDAFLARYAGNMAEGFGARPVVPPPPAELPRRRAEPHQAPRRRSAKTQVSGAEIAAQVNAMKRGDRLGEPQPMPRWLFNIIVVVCFTGVGVAGLFVVVRCAT